MTVSRSTRGWAESLRALGAPPAPEGRRRGYARASAAVPTGFLDVWARTSDGAAQEACTNSVRGFAAEAHRDAVRASCRADTSSFAAARDGAEVAANAVAETEALLGHFGPRLEVFCPGIWGCLVVGRSGSVAGERGRVCARLEET